MSFGVPIRLLLAVALLAPLAAADEAPSAARAEMPALYLVGYAHLDTQWRWEYPQVIEQFLPATLRQNFALLDRYPDYVFNFTGANRYALLEEYHPQQFRRLQRYVREGRWFPGGSSMEESDLDIPSPESLWRQILYGNEFFRREFGVAGDDFMDPDAFGYPAALPSVLAHAGLKGFSTQKLDPRWGAAVAIPFDLGLWVGPDGRGIVAALNPGSYDSKIDTDLSADAGLASLLEAERQRSGVALDYRYYGTGDTGGAPDERSVQNLERSVHGGGPVHVVSARSDQLFQALTPQQIERLPRYRGDLLLTQHSAGSLTSEAYMKHWNNRNEVLADAAERAALAASWLGAQAYPHDRLQRAWRLVLGAQFHDILAGTATPKAYEYSWNDEIVALNEFATVVTGAMRGVASGLDTSGPGTALVVYNPLSVEREDAVEAELELPMSAHTVRVLGPEGREVPAQLEPPDSDAASTVRVAAGGPRRVKVVFIARLPPLGVAVYHVEGLVRAVAAATALRVGRSGLENERYRVRIDGNGDIASIFDKRLQRELLAAPLRLALLSERPREYPAWNMDWEDQRRPPRAFLSAPTQIRVVEEGAARVGLRVTRTAGDSRFEQTIRLAAGDAGERIEIVNAIDWRTSAAALKATLPLTAANGTATYSLGLGTIARGNDDAKKYEVPAHQWFDLTDRSGAFGVTVLTGDKYGSDKPDDRTLRLTLLYTPAARTFADQATQDWGHHEFIYGLAAHAGDWTQQQNEWQAERLNAPPLVFASAPHAGMLGTSFSLLRLSTPEVGVVALKRAEGSDEWIVRLLERNGRAVGDASIRFVAPVLSVRELDAQERALDPAATSAAGRWRLLDGTLHVSLGPYQPRTFALRLAPPAQALSAPRSYPLALPYDIAAATRAGEHATGFDASGAALPAELLPEQIHFQGIEFRLGRPDGAEAMSSNGQTLALPACGCDQLYVLAAADDRDRPLSVRLGDQTQVLTVQQWNGYVGQWDRRIFRGGDPPAPGWDPAPKLPLVRRLRPGYKKPAAIAWFASHHHDARGSDVAYSYVYLFAYGLPLSPGARRLTLARAPHVKILALTAAQDLPALQPAAPLY